MKKRELRSGVVVSGMCKGGTFADLLCIQKLSLKLRRTTFPRYKSTINQWMKLNTTKKPCTHQIGMSPKIN